MSAGKRSVENPVIDGDLADDVRAGAETLIRRMAVETHKAGRARIGSHGREKALANAGWLRWAAGQVVADRKLQAHLRHLDVMRGGWRALAVAIGDWVRNAQAKAAA